MSTGDPADSVGAGSHGHREPERCQEVPEYELAVLHLGRTGNDRRGDEDGEATPPRVGLFTSFEHPLTPVVMLARPLGELPAPVVADPVADETTELSGDRGDDDDRGQCRLALAGSNRRRRQSCRADARHPGPGRGDGQEEQGGPSCVCVVDGRRGVHQSELHRLSMPGSTSARNRTEPVDGRSNLWCVDTMHSHRMATARWK